MESFRSLLTLLSALTCCRKNWTSSWTVLQGSTLLFAKSQGGGTSWVSPATPRKIGSKPERERGRGESLTCAVSTFPSVCLVALNCFSSPCSLVSHLPPSLHPPRLSIRSVSTQPHYHSGSLPEFLLSLLANWRPPAKKHPAVSFGCSELRRASSVCASSSSSACRLHPVPHTLTSTPPSRLVADGQLNTREEPN